MNEIEEMRHQHLDFMNILNRDMERIRYSLDELRESTKKLEYSMDLEKFVEEKLGVTREGECAEKINAMSTEEFVAFYKEAMDDWDARQREYDDYEAMSY